MLRRRRFVLASVFLGLLLSACSRGQIAAPVGVKVLAHDLVFGVPPLPQPAAPPGAVPPPVPPDYPAPASGNTITPRRFPSLPPPAPACPTADANTFPAESAPLDIENQPKVGSYKWKYEGQQAPPIPGLPPLRFKGLETRLVRDLATDAINQQNFTFKTVQGEPGLSQKVITSTFEVNLSNPDRAIRGVRLLAIETKEENGAVTNFRPNPPVMYLPSPVRVGEAARFTSTGVDPASLQVLQHTGFVTGRTRVDACGQVIDSWLVDGEQTFTHNTQEGPRTTQSNYDYSIATHFGGLIVKEHRESPCATVGSDGACNPPGDLVFNNELGQIEPGPLPS